jgi:Aspartyl protease
MRSTRGVVLAVVLALVDPTMAVYAASTPDVIEVPFEFYRDSIIVQAKIAGQGPFNVLLDTGVDPSVIDIATAKSIGLKIASQGGQGSGSGSEVNLAYETSLPLVELGDLKARKVAALASNLSKMSETLGKPLVGVLGYSLLKDRIVQFDYPHRVVRFLRNAPRRAKANGANRTTMPFRYRDEILLDDVTINGKRVVANLDTGSNATFQMAPATVTALELQQDAAIGEATSSVGFNGATSNRKGSLRNVTIGTLTIDQAPVVFLGANGGHDEEQWGLRIGNAFLKGYVVTVDYRHHRVTLEAD